MNNSPISSAARAYAKGINTLTLNMLDANAERAQRYAFHPTASRAVNYRKTIEHAMARMEGSVLLRITRQHDRRKDQDTHIFYSEPLSEGGLGVSCICVQFKDPLNPLISRMPVTITKHCIARLAQRNSDRVGPITPLCHALKAWALEGLPDGKYEIGCGTGICIMEIEEGEGMTIITFVDADKLRANQSAAIGANRKIGEIQ